MQEKKTGERLAVLEQKVETSNKRIDNHTSRIEKLESNNDVLIRLSTLMEVQTEMDKQQNEQMEKFGEVLNSVNSNLTHLNQTSDQLKSNVGVLSGRIESIEKSQEDYKIDVPKLFTNIVVGAITAIAVGFAVYFFGVK